MSEIRKPKLSDINSDHDLFRELPPSLFLKIERSVYNRKKKMIVLLSRNLRKQITSLLDTSYYFIADSDAFESMKIKQKFSFSYF